MVAKALVPEQMGRTTMSDKPRRIQRKREKGWRMPPNTVYVGRGSKWGNPYPVGMHLWFLEQIKPETESLTAEQSIMWFKRYLCLEPFPRADLPSAFYPRTVPTVEMCQKELKGKNLACWCKEGDVCHADVLLELANPS